MELYNSGAEISLPTDGCTSVINMHAKSLPTALSSVTDSFMRTPATVWFHPLNHIGLGHMNRLSVIALALRDIDPRVRTPFVVEGASHVLLDTFALPYVPLPVSYAMTDGGVWAAWAETERCSLQFQIAPLFSKVSVLRLSSSIACQLLPSRRQ